MNLKNQKGFSVFEVLLTIVIIGILGSVGWLVHNRTNGKPSPQSNSSKTADTRPSGTYTSENYTLNITDDDSVGVSNPYSLEVEFNDSWNPAPTCPLKQPGFAGKITVKNMTAGGTALTLTQNREPYTPKPTSPYIDCGQGTTTMDPDTSQYDLSTAWLESGPSSKTLTINGKRYTLNVDKTGYSLTISNGPITTGVLYFPESIGALYSEPSNCMSVARLKAYAQANGMELAQTKYPGSGPVLNAGTTGIPGDPSSQQILVIASSSFIKLSRQTTQQQACQVQASDSTVSGDVGNGMGDITIGAKTGD